MAWFKKTKQPLSASDRRDLPADVFEKCKGCGEILYAERMLQNVGVCPECGFHTRIAPERYLEILLDDDSFEEMDQELLSGDPLEFVDLKPYADRLVAARKKLGRNEAVITGRGVLDGTPVALAVMDFRFIGGSMGSVVGEKIARAAHLSAREEIPLIIISASGGARMMEGIFSLMQLAKTSTALARLHEAGIPFISVITDPTTGGVTASFAMLGDMNFAEPGALIGFAGARVIEETIRQELPEGFQRSEFLLKHGMLDRVVDRRELRETLSRALRLMTAQPEPEAESE
jgi:acetyl-CoA carboxylase carboxyl transferase subunit beta